ncbi:MAG: AtpZ/AtpI family protein [Alphaproteobacteria bacterium]|nr:MAG: AtpZ/AtpI family protein [Alphaproteobacteria bacterium]
MTADNRDKDREGSAADDAERFGKRLSDLGDKLDAASARRDKAQAAEKRGNALGLAFRITTELVAGVVVGGFVGWQLDKWLDTSPVMLLIFFAFGAAAGISNVMRTAREMQAGAASAEDGPKRPENGSGRK